MHRKQAILRYVICVMANDTESDPAEQDFHIVGIGASAGGLRALESFFQNVELGHGLTYVVIQHLSPDFKSLMGELLARQTDLPISLVVDGETIEPNRVYLIPPRNILIVENNCFRLSEANSSPSLPVDAFFESLSLQYEKRAIGIVLSGTGSDGMRGSKSIKNAGGYVIVQDPETAEFDGMPRSVILSGAFDQLSGPSEMPALLLRLKSGTVTRPQDDSTHPISSVAETLRRAYGLDLDSYKKSTVNRRIQRRVEMVGETSVENYSTRLSHDAQELDLLYRDLLIGVTSFFRDPEVWKYLKTEILTPLFQRAKDQDFRAWVAGCATGEEAYSLCMLLMEHAESIQFQGSIHVFATDLHPGSLSIASEGVYSLECLQDVPPDLLEKYFVKEGGSYRVSPSLRAKVVFASHNLILDPPFTRLDIVTCRNLLIYLEPPAQEKALSMLLFGLRKRGALLLGSSENPNLDELGLITKNANLKAFEKVRQMPIADLPSTPSNHSARPFRQRLKQSKNVTLDSQLLADYDAILASQLGDGFIIGEQYQVLQYIGNPNVYLKPLSGRASPSLLNQLAGELHLALSTCLQRVNASKSAFNMHGVRYSPHEDDPLLDLHVAPLGKTGGDIHYFVSIRRREPSATQTSSQEQRVDEDYHPREARSQRIAELELELQANRENLQAAIEQAQMSNEELQATNEELLASNEELQSTNEELHSVNEELFSVNSEFEQKNVELHGLNQDYDRLLSSLVNIGILYLDGKLQVKKFNQAVTSIFKLVKGDVGRPIEHISYSLGRQEKFLRRVRKVLEERIPISFESETPDGEYLMVRIFPYGDREEAEDGVIITFTNISEVKQAQSRLETAVGVSKIVWWDWDIRENRLQTYCHNVKGFNCILGYSQENIPKSYDAWIDATHPDDVDRVKASLQAHFKGQTDNWSSEHRYRDPKGNWVWVRDSGEVVQRSSDGAPLKMVGTTQNIHERKKLEQLLLANDEENKKLLAQAQQDSIELKEMAEAAERASTAKSQFLAMMSHEIRTPLNAIIGYSDLMLNLDLEDEVKENLLPISTAGQNLLGIIGDILDFSKLESDAMELEESVFAIREVLENACTSIPTKEGVDLKCNLIDSSFRTFKKELWLKGDPVRLGQIIINLLGNSVKFTKKGEVTLTVQICSTQNNVAALRFAVRDDGLGIKKEDLDTIFQPFVQSDCSISRKHNGTGLGLSISKRLVEAMKGTIRVESEYGEGSVFTFEIQLPIYESDAPRSVAVTRKPSERLLNPQVLIIEDDLENARLLAKMLRSIGAESDTAENGQQGIEMLFQKDYDIVFMDLSMPKLDGINATRTIKSVSDDRFKNLTIVALTASATVENRKLCEKVGMDDFISKPATLSKIKAVMDTYFNLGELA